MFITSSAIAICNVRQSYCARYWYRLDLCLSVCPSVIRVETAQPIDKLSYLPGSLMILVFWGPNFFPEIPMGTPQTGKVNASGVGKIAISDQYLARKWLKIDGYMLWCVWPAVNHLSIHVTFTAIVLGAYPGEAKMCLRLSWGSHMPPPAKWVKA